MRSSRPVARLVCCACSDILSGMPKENWEGVSRWIKTTRLSGAGSSATAAIRAIGPRFDGEVLAATRALYDGHWDLSLPTGGNLHFNLAYGRDVRQALDLASLAGRTRRYCSLCLAVGSSAATNPNTYMLPPPSHASASQPRS